MKQKELQMLFALTCLAFVNATNKPISDWPVLLFKKGETAYIPCPPQGHANAFFWRKGELFNVSENIASIVHGIPDTSEKYDVLVDGTLVIMDMSLDDVGKYYCRIASEKNECHGSITLYLEVSTGELDIAIEGCTSTSSCVKVLEPSMEFQLTCTANMIAESLTLKWHNGSKEIIGNVDVSETFGQKVMITNVIKFIFEDESHLTCVAEAINIAKSIAAIHLKKKEVFIPVEKKATITLLVPTIVLGIICLILTGICICLIVCYWKLKKQEGTTKDSHSLEMSPQVEEQSDDKKKDQNAEQYPLVTSKEENDTDLATKEGALQKLQEEINKKNNELMEQGNEVKKLQIEMKGTKKTLEENRRKLEIAERDLKQRENEAEQLKRTDKQNATADITIVNLQKELQDTKKHLTTAETAVKNLTDTNRKLIASENTTKKLQEDLKEANAKHSSCKNTIKELQKDLQEECTKLSKCEDTKQIFITKIIEMKDKILLNQPESIPTVIIGVKGELSKGGCNYEDVMPKPKYGNVSLVSGSSYQTNIFDKIKDKVETCFSGKDTYIFVFGRVESKLHHTLHGEKDNNGLIKMVAHVIFLLSNQLKEKGFQVNINVSTASIALDEKVQRFRSPTVRAEGTDKVKLRNGVEITLNKYSVESKQSLLKIVNHLTPNEGSTRHHGLLKVTVESLVGKTTVSKGIIFIASIINLMKILKVFNGNLEDSFEEVISLLTRNSKGDLVLIPNVDPGLADEPRRTFEAVKKTLDAYR